MLGIQWRRVGKSSLFFSVISLASAILFVYCCRPSVEQWQLGAFWRGPASCPTVAVTSLNQELTAKMGLYVRRQSGGGGGGLLPPPLPPLSLSPFIYLLSLSSILIPLLIHIVILP